MAQINRALQELKSTYLIACRAYQAKQMTKDEFNILLLRTLEQLIVMFDDYEPWMTDFRETYQKELSEAKKRFFLESL